MPSLVRTFCTALLLTFGVSGANAAEPVVPETAPPASTPRSELPERGFTFGMHFGLGSPLLKATPQERHYVAGRLGARFGYRFAPSLAVYLDGSGYFSVGGSNASLEYTADGTPYGGEALTAVGIASLPIAVRPVRWFEVSAAPALGTHAGNLVGGAVGHISFPIRLERITLSPLVQVTGLTSKLWSQVALTAGLGLDW
jgi:hypothetical protein